LGNSIFTETAHAAPTVPTKWDKEADVIVVGTGFTGLAATVTAAEAGAKVIVLEKASQLEEGGNSKVSGNMWWTPTDAENGFKYIQALAYGQTDDESLKALTAEMVKLNDWLSKKFGVVPKSIGGLFEPEHPELPGAESVRTWGNNGQTLASQLYLPIREYVGKLNNVEFMYETPAKELIQAPNGEIVGIQADSGGKPINIKAARGVVLGTGGFEFDFEMARQFLPGWPVFGRGTPHNTGDGIKMSQKVGAALWHMNNTLGGFGCLMVPEYAPVLINLSMPAMGYIFVDKFGERFMNELRPNRHGFGHKEYQLFFDGILGDFTRNPWWTVFDEATRLKGRVAMGNGTKFTWFNAHGDYEWSKDNSAEVAKGWILTSPDLGALASQMDVDPQVLISTVTQYNDYCKAKVDADFERPEVSLLPLEKGPFYAMKTYPATYNTQGGPKRNAKCQILDVDGNPIPRLYSGGEMGSFWGWMYNGGGNNAEALSTGQIAGRNAAAERPWTPET
jgi:succinate dehydrogenase/fumarate reductase flavoprotein subunit